jgi:hypothetical protein
VPRAHTDREPRPDPGRSTLRRTREAVTPATRALPRGPVGQPLKPEAVLALQRTIGNAAVVRLLQRQVADSNAAVRDAPCSGGPVVQRTIKLGDSAEAGQPLAYAAAVGLLLRNGGAGVGHSVVNDMIKSDRVFADEKAFINEALARPVHKEDLTLGELARLSADHTSEVGKATAEFSSPTSTMLRGISTGSSFSSKFDDNGVLGGNLTPAMVEELKSRVDGFGQFSGRLRDMLHPSMRDKKLQVYRSTAVPPDRLQVGEVIRQPLPFSTTYSHDFAAGSWGDKPVLLEITAPMRLSMVSISQLGSEDTGYKPLNQEQMEVTLAPCSLKITAVQQTSAGRYFVKAVAEPHTTAEVGQDLEAAEEAAREAQRRRKIEWTVDDTGQLGMYFDAANVTKIEAFGKREDGEIVVVTHLNGTEWDVFDYDATFGATFTRDA